jgi:hypothetical protein
MPSKPFVYDSLQFYNTKFDNNIGIRTFYRITAGVKANFKKIASQNGINPQITPLKACYLPKNANP